MINTETPQPYEVHITIKEGDTVKFSLACERANVKPVFLENYTKSGNLRDLLTSSAILTGDWDSVLKEITRVGRVLTDSGFEIARAKVETWPFHPAAPTQLNATEMPKGCYFEAHMEVTANNEWLGQLSDIAKRHGAYLSRNFYKRGSKDAYVIMFTLRNHEGSRKQFLECVDILENDLAFLGFEVKEPETEFAIYDTNVQHDDLWFSNAL